ncbi:MAG: OmpA family protein [Gammaproteobacteria bacterium]|nr:OmpA family protein [Gammaproteobacteria bacterium]
MKQLITDLKFITVLCIAGLIYGCASTTPNPDLVSAERLFDEINADPLVAAKAPIPHAEAEESLAKLKRMVDDGAKDEEIKRVAYKTEIKTKIAREKANTAIAKDFIAQAESERQQIQIKARTREADELARQLAELKAKPSERGMIVTMGDVLFEYDKSNVKAGGMRIISQLAEFLKQHPEITVRIEGHTDSVGSDSYNQQLSERRAEAVQRALRYAGINDARMTAIGYGETYPIATNATSSGRQLNRRVEIIISDETGIVKER